jgi:hypothetical protein
MPTAGEYNNKPLHHFPPPHSMTAAKKDPDGNMKFPAICKISDGFEQCQAML